MTTGYDTLGATYPYQAPQPYDQQQPGAYTNNQQGYGQPTQPPHHHQSPYGTPAPNMVQTLGTPINSALPAGAHLGVTKTGGVYDNADAVPSIVSHDYHVRSPCLNAYMLQALCYGGLIALTPLILRAWSDEYYYSSFESVNVFFIVWSWSFAPLLLLTTLPGLCSTNTKAGLSQPYVRDARRSYCSAQGRTIWHAMKFALEFAMFVWSFVFFILLTIEMRSSTDSWDWEHFGHIDALKTMCCGYTTLFWAITTICQWHNLTDSRRRGEFINEARKAQREAERNPA